MSFWSTLLYGEQQYKRYDHMKKLETRINSLIESRNNTSNSYEADKINKEISSLKSDFDIYKVFWETENSRMNRTFAVIAGYLGAAGFVFPIMKDLYNSLQKENKEYGEIYIFLNIAIVTVIFILPVFVRLIQLFTRWIRVRFNH